MPDIMMRLGKYPLVLEGAMGTMLQRAGMLPGTCPELLNVSDPEMVGEVHKLYALAGCDATTTNTFGGSRPKLAEYGYEDRVAELNRAAVRVAREYGAPHILADVGPTGLVLEPLGSAKFEEVYDAFAEQVSALAAENPDAIFFETFTDIAEARCGVLAAKAVAPHIPVFASVTFGLAGRMDLSGTDPATAAVILEAAGADAVGMNCGLGPEQMLPLVEAMCAATTLPVIVQPNAGMPTLDADGKTVFPGTPELLEEHARRYFALGAAAVGGCCGTTPAYLATVAFAAEDARDVVAHGPAVERLRLAGPRRVVRFGAGCPVRVVGERINPTGKPALKDSLLAGSLSIVRTFAGEQEHGGADALDVNVGAAGVEAVAMLPAAVIALAGTADAPLVIDTTDYDALEAALRVYPGRALINSVNGGEESIARVLPLAARYGAAVVVLALDDDGIPHDARGRVAIVERVRAAAHAAGLSDSDLIVDGLVMTAATDADAPATTLAVVRAMTDAGLATILGLSNVSHGLPNRPLLNAAFVTAAAAEGLSAAIANPNDPVLMEAVKAANADRENGEVPTSEQAAALWASAYDAAMEIVARGGAGEQAAGESAQAALDPKAALETAIMRGDAEAAPALVDALVADGVTAESIIPGVLTPAIQRLGDAFGRGEAFLPQLIVSAEAMKAAVAQVKTYLPEGDGSGEGRVAFATVKGDIHSIGKDICVSMLESQGFVVEDLGVDVPAEKVLDAASRADVVCLSALMTTTLRAMGDSVAAVREAHADVPVFVGGAVVTPEWAASVGAGYSSDAPGCVEVVRAAVAAKRG